MRIPGLSSAQRHIDKGGPDFFLLAKLNDGQMNREWEDAFNFTVQYST